MATECYLKQKYYIQLVLTWKTLHRYKMLCSFFLPKKNYLSKVALLRAVNNSVTFFSSSVFVSIHLGYEELGGLCWMLLTDSYAALQMEKYIHIQPAPRFYTPKLCVDVLLLQHQIGQHLTERNLIILRAELHFMHKIKPSSHQERFFIFWNLHHDYHVPD